MLDLSSSFAAVDSCRPGDCSASDNSSCSAVAAAGLVGVESVVAPGQPSGYSREATVSLTWVARVVVASALTSRPSSPRTAAVVSAEVAC